MKGITHWVKHMVVAADAGLFATRCNLRPEREEKNTNTGQPHEDASAEEEEDKNQPQM